jgi:hypothetical protein
MSRQFPYRRRDIPLGAATAALGRRVGQEAPKSAQIGFIVTGEAYPRRGFDEATRRLGWVEGSNLIIERRVTRGRPGRTQGRWHGIGCGRP